MNEKLLFVDDEVNTLMALKRQFISSEYQVTLAHSGKDALEQIENNGSFAVMVTDYRMPGIDGIKLLEKVTELDQQIIKIMLTGYADINVALEAINKGQIFRFLSKPCETEDLFAAVEAGMKQYRLVVAERELLQQTLTGSIRILTDILSILNPKIYDRSVRMGRIAKRVAEKLNLENLWEIELAAMLSQIGVVTVPEELLEKNAAGVELTIEEEKIFYAHPLVGSRLLQHIPRLESISTAIKYQFKGYDGSGPPEDALSGDRIPMAGRILKVAQDYYSLLELEHEAVKALNRMENNSILYDPAVFAVFKNEVIAVEEGYRIERISLNELIPGMIIAADVKDRKGTILLHNGSLVDSTLIVRLNNYAQLRGVMLPITVYTKIK